MKSLAARTARTYTVTSETVASETVSRAAGELHRKGRGSAELAQSQKSAPSIPPGNAELTQSQISDPILASKQASEPSFDNPKHKTSKLSEQEQVMVPLSVVETMIQAAVERQMKSSRVDSSHREDVIELHPEPDSELEEESRYGDRRDDDLRSFTSRRDNDHEEGNEELDLQFRQVLEILQRVLGDDLPVREDVSQRIYSLSKSNEEVKRVKAFPPSPLIASCFSIITENYAGVHAPDMTDPVKAPERMNSKLALSRKMKIMEYKDKYYSTKVDAFAVNPPEVDHLMLSHAHTRKEEVSNLKVTYDKLVSLEKSARRAVLTSSSSDLIVAAIRRLMDKADLPLDDRAVFDSLFESLTKSVNHTCMLAAQTVAASMMARRTAFVDHARRAVPESAREWMLCQPFIAEKQQTSLFGPIIGKIQNLTKKDAELSAQQAISSGFARPSSGFRKPAPAGYRTPQASARQQSYQSRQSSFRGQSQRGSRGRSSGRRGRRGARW